MSDCMSSVWAYSVHKISDVKILKNLLSPTVFNQFQPNFIVSMLVMREYKLLFFWEICQNLKILWHFEFLLTQDHMRLKIL